MGQNVADTGAGGGEWTGLRPVLQVRSTSCPAIWAGDVGPDSPYGLDPQGLPPQGGPSADGLKARATSRHGVVLPTPGGGYAVDRAGDNR